MTEPLLGTGKEERDAAVAVDVADVPHRARFARMTTFHLIPDKDGLGFVSGSAAVDAVIGRQVSNQTKKQRGYVDATKLLDSDTGECRVISFWETRADLLNSEEDRDYYLGAQNEFSSFVRYRMFRTEHFAIVSVGPKEYERRGRLRSFSSSASSSIEHVHTDEILSLEKTRDEKDRDVANVGVEMTPFVRISTVRLRANVKIGDVDRYLVGRIRDETRHLEGFCGAHRLLEVGGDDGDSRRKYVVLTYWSTAGRLRATARGTDYYENIAKGMRRYILSDVVTQDVQHLRYERSVKIPAATPFFEAGSSTAATFQLACISLGVGIFVVPSVLSGVGPGLGILLIVMFGALADVGMQCLLRAAEMTGAQSFDGVFAHVFGEAGRGCALVSMAIACWTANCSHMKFIASLFCSLQGDDGGFLAALVGPNHRVQLMLSLCIFGGFALPFCFKRTLGELRHVSLVVVGFCACAAALVCAKCVKRIVDDNGGHLKNVSTFAHLDDARQLLDVAPIAAFGYSLVAELFAIRSEMKRPHELKMCAHKASAIVTSIYVVVGLIGASAFEDPGSNLLSQWSSDRSVAWVSFGLILVITLLYPLINWVIVHSVHDFALSLGLLRANGATSAFARKRIITVAVLCFTIGLCTAVDDLSYVFALAGSLGLGLIAFVLPSAVYLTVAMRADRVGVSPCFIAASVACLCVGSVMTVGSTTSVVWNIAAQ